MAALFPMVSLPAAMLVAVLASTARTGAAQAVQSRLRPKGGSPLYTVEGTVDVFTYESTPFYWAGTVYLLENIPCEYADHASRWFPEYANQSYVRIRELRSGHVVANVSETIGWGFVTAFPDYEHQRVWLFGTGANRCNGNGHGTRLFVVVHWEHPFGNVAVWVWSRLGLPWIVFPLIANHPFCGALIPWTPPQTLPRSNPGGARRRTTPPSPPGPRRPRFPATRRITSRCPRWARWDRPAVL